MKRPTEEEDEAAAACALLDDLLALFCVAAADVAEEDTMGSVRDVVALLCTNTAYQRFLCTRGRLLLLRARIPMLRLNWWIDRCAAVGEEEEWVKERWRAFRTEALRAQVLAGEYEWAVPFCEPLGVVFYLRYGRLPRHCRLAFAYEETAVSSVISSPAGLDTRSAGAWWEAVERREFTPLPACAVYLGYRQRLGAFRNLADILSIHVALLQQATTEAWRAEGVPRSGPDVIYWVWRKEAEDRQALKQLLYGCCNPRGESLLFSTLDALAEYVCALYYHCCRRGGGELPYSADATAEPPFLTVCQAFAVLERALAARDHLPEWQREAGARDEPDPLLFLLNK
jgi:hypothetical protein